MDIEMTGGSGPELGSAALDVDNPLRVVADVISEALGLRPEPGSVFGPAPASAPQWQIEAGS